jgi:LysR family hydrogen peroxide-inducible transcriptional activator
MSLQDFRYIAAVSSLRHLGRPTEACHVIQLTLSSQIRKLEEEHGVALFDANSVPDRQANEGENMGAQQRALQGFAMMQGFAIDRMFIPSLSGLSTVD